MQSIVPQSVKPAAQEKLPLRREELRDVVDLSLWTGQLLLQYGAEAAVVEETTHRIGTALGCDWEDILVSPNALIITTVSNNEFRTRVRRVSSLGVNFTVVSAISRLSRRVEAGELDRHQVRAELQRISKTPHHYNRWLTALMVGLSCAAFSRLFGGDWAVFGVTLAAATLAMLLRQELLRRHFNALLVTVATAFAAGLLASTATLFELSPHGDTALIAAVLMLVPGVPLINAVEDVIKGYPVLGLVRATTGVLMLLGIALGLLLAIGITGLAPL